MCKLCKDAVGKVNHPPIQLNKNVDGYRIFLSCSNCRFGYETNATIFIIVPLGTKKKDVDLKSLKCPHCGCEDCLR